MSSILATEIISCYLAILDFENRTHQTEEERNAIYSDIGSYFLFIHF
jgi:hypothetical protein